MFYLKINIIDLFQFKKKIDCSSSIIDLNNILEDIDKESY